MKLPSFFKAAVKANLPMLCKSGSEPTEMSSSCNFHVAFTPKRSAVRHPTCIEELSQTVLETRVPNVFTCMEKKSCFRNREEEETVDVNHVSGVLVLCCFLYFHHPAPEDWVLKSLFPTWGSLTDTLSLNQALTDGKAGTYLDLAEAMGYQLIQYEDLEGLQQARVVNTAHLAWWEQELEVCLSLHGLPQLRPCSQAQEVRGLRP